MAELTKSEQIIFLKGCKAQYILDLHMAKDKEHKDEIKNCLADVEKKLKKLLK